MTRKTGLCRTVASLEDDLRLAEVNLRDAQRRNRELEKEMQQIIARQGSCPYAASSGEGTQSCRLNGGLESVLGAIEKEIGEKRDHLLRITWCAALYDRYHLAAQWLDEETRRIVIVNVQTKEHDDAITEAAIACLEEIRKVKSGD